MKLLKIYIPFLLLALFSLVACKKNQDIFVPDPGQINGFDTNWVSTINVSMPISLLKSKLLIPVQRDSFLVSSSIVISISATGLKSVIQPAILLDSNNLQVTGKIFIESFLLKKKGDLIRMNKPTFSNGRVLATAGTVFINYKKEGKPLHLYQTTRVNIQFTEPPSTQPMKLHFGEDLFPDRFNWVPNADSLLNYVNATNYGYEILTNRLGWINTGYILDGFAAQINVRAKLSSQFTNANTMAYLVFKNNRSVVNLFGEPSSKSFSSGGIPVGKEAIIVVLSKLANDYYLGSETFTTAAAAGSINQQVTVTPVKKSIETINQFLDNL